MAMADIHDIWHRWADDVHLQDFDSDHHMAEEAPAQLAQVLRTFLLESQGEPVSDCS